LPRKTKGGGSTTTYSIDDDSQKKAQNEMSLLNSRMEALARARAALTGETRLLRAERDRLNSEHREVTGKLKELRSRERQLRDHTDELRNRIVETRSASVSAQEQAEQLRVKVDKAKSQAKRNPEDVSNELRELNWELQTSPTNMTKEKGLMKRIKEVSAEQHLHERIGELELRLAEAQARRLGLRLSLSRDWEALKGLRDARDSLREEIAELSARATSVKSKADEAHQRYLEKRVNLETLGSEMRKIALEMEGLRDQLEARRQEEERSKLKAIAGEARRRLGRGGKITFQELQALSVDEPA